MRRSLLAGIGIVATGIIALLSAEASSRVPEMAANGLLHPLRRTVFQRIPENCETATFAGAGVVLQGLAMPRG